MRTQVKETSFDAFYHLKATRALQAREQKILDNMWHGERYTRRELAQLTGLETSCVAGRINSMLDVVVRIDGTKKCSISGRNVEALVRI